MKLSFSLPHWLETQTAATDTYFCAFYSASNTTKVWGVGSKLKLGACECEHIIDILVLIMRNVCKCELTFNFKPKTKQHSKGLCMSHNKALVGIKIACPRGRQKNEKMCPFPFGCVFYTSVYNNICILFVILPNVKLMKFKCS
jgi:hypothetical protein